MDQPEFPLRASDDRRCLVDQLGKPFLIHGDSPWSLITALTPEETRQYLNNRATKGFTALIVNLIEHKFNGPLTRAGEPPFVDPWDLTTPNEAYFAHAAWVIEQAAARGMVVFLAPLFLGYRSPRSDEGWANALRRNGPGNLFTYGRYIGERLSRCKNIIWLIGCDRTSKDIEDEINALVAGIRTPDSSRLFAAQPAPDEITPDWYGGTQQGGWLDLNTTYTYQIVHKRLLVDYNRKPRMPFVLLESVYEGEHNASPVQIRRQAYWAILCGACGQFMGNNPVWLFNPGWQAAMDLDGSRSMVHVKTFFSSREWHTLVPDQRHVVVTHGLGEHNGMDYLAAALTEDSRTLMAYMPSAREVTIDLDKVSGMQHCAWWFNPRIGAAEPAGKFQGRGLRTLVPPGAGDWALVLDDAALKLPAPGA